MTAIGYALVEDARPGRFDVDVATSLGVPDGPDRGRLQRGEPVTLADGRVVAPGTCSAARAGRKLVLTGDTAPVASVVDAAAGADVLVHEATFLADERERARETSHSTAGEAALAASAAGVKLLALTHVSTRYFGHQVLEEAQEVFPATVVPRDFDVVAIPFSERGKPELIRSGARTAQPARTELDSRRPDEPVRSRASYTHRRGAVRASRAGHRRRARHASGRNRPLGHGSVRPSLNPRRKALLPSRVSWSSPRRTAEHLDARRAAPPWRSPSRPRPRATR